MWHFSIKESISNYDAKLSKEEFKNYIYVFLGHIHSYQLIKPNIVHLGSSLYVSFDEAGNIQKVIVLISNYGEDTEKVHFMKLKSPIPMIQLELSKNGINTAMKDASDPEKVISGAPSEEIYASESGIETICQKLDKTDPKTKVKVKILDFESFKLFLPFVDKYSNKFEVFKYSTEFDSISVNTQKEVLAETTSFKESFSNYLKNQNIDPEITKILQKEIE